MTTHHGERILVTVTGRDHPGIVSRLTRCLLDSGADLLDIEQVVVQGRLILCLLVGFERRSDGRVSGEHLLKDLLFLGKQLGLGVDFELAGEQPPKQGRRDFVVTLIAERLGPSALHSLSQRLAQHGANIDRIQRLTEDELSALEVLFSLPDADAPAGALKRDLLDLSLTENVDVAIQPNDVYRRSKRLVVMDMDSTLISIEVIDELAKRAGIGEKVAQITRRAMAGELDYDESLRQRVALLAGLDARHLDDIAANLPLTDGAETLIQALKALGLRTAVLSGGFDVPARALQKRLGLDDAHSNVLEVQDGKLTGRVVGRIVNAQTKADLLEQIARDEGISLDQTVAIGDGANDMLMIQRAGLGIAFHGKPKLREAAHSSLSGGLDSALYLLGIGARELRDLRQRRRPADLSSPSA